MLGRRCLAARATSITTLRTQAVRHVVHDDERRAGASRCTWPTRHPTYAYDE
ncbi:MAG: hypothetical protein ACYC1I_04430 [Acidimicrobiales bacterium]